MSEVVEGTVTVKFNEGRIPDIDLSTEDEWDSLTNRLGEFEGQRVRVTIEVLSE